MSRLPNPFVSGQGNQQRTPQRPPTPGFLLLTRPPLGSNSYGGLDYQSPPASGADSFIPFSNIGNSSSSISSNNRRNNNRGGAKFSFNRVVGDGRHGNHASPRFAYPYQQSPSGMLPSPHHKGHGFSNSPSGRYNANSSGMRYSTPRGNFGSGTSGGRFNSGNRRGGRFNDRQERSFSDYNNRCSPHGNSRGRGPISDIPIDKFISESMIHDPWSGLNNESDNDLQVEKGSPVIISLDDSEIIIDSDASALVENSFDGVVSDTEVDSSPVHDTGSDSPNIATSSTSEKDTGSDSGSDTDT